MHTFPASPWLSGVNKFQAKNSQHCFHSVPTLHLCWPSCQAERELGSYALRIHLHGAIVAEVRGSLACQYHSLSIKHMQINPETK